MSRSNLTYLIASFIVIQVLLLVYYISTSMHVDTVKNYQTDSVERNYKALAGVHLLMQQHLFQLKECIQFLRSPQGNVTIACERLLRQGGIQPGLPPHAVYLEEQPLAGSIRNDLREWVKSTGAECEDGIDNIQQCPCISPQLSE